MNSRAITKEAIDNSGAYWQCCCPYRVVPSAIWLAPKRVPYETLFSDRSRKPFYMNSLFKLIVSYYAKRKKNIMKLQKIFKGESQSHFSLENLEFWHKRWAASTITPPLFQGYYQNFSSSAGCRKAAGNKFCADPQRGHRNALLRAHTFEPD